MTNIFRFLLKTCLWLLVLSILWVLTYKWINPYATPLMWIKHLQSKSNKTIRHQWVPLAKISKNLQLAVICSEDQQFVAHSGFDTKAISTAIQEYQSGKRLRGASTISQQTAKNIFLWPKRSWIRKGLEIYFTLLIETLWSKERILEVYLNSIEMGDEIYGAQAASIFWFNKSAMSLTVAEASAIAAILPNPIKYLANPPSDYIQKRKKWIRIQMRNYGTLTFEIKKE
ncbi:monofunctional biosynthetic peptidoglycan transglycosylase [Aquimarina sp. RZ0]|uniref:monofunctional biosynthetic peptidoglycan transglycosylase n=1 Tax=Aquimarina sp. RZ0 TaxID=2607730 RepID=UPI0011F31858|nr:monofunctional biosynthetic peptidoglycan transglycosylase [Aquimarina sp. RZ0]KAA1247331.1 monofunctional biosynthetic peptidoglycan transglycosylase [Aquimarina sp. RZ0]